MIFAAGLGTRLKPLTDTMPKALVKVGGQPLLWHTVMKLKAAGYEHMVVNVHHFAQQIVDYLKQNDNFGLDIRISDESDKLLETGGGIKKALPLFDLLSNLDLTALDGSVTTLVVSPRQTKRYLLFDDDLYLRGWTNIETGEVKGEVTDADSYRKLAFSGIHVLHPSLFPLMDEWPDRFPIMDFYLKVCARHPIRGCQPCGLRLMDVGKLDTLHEAEQFLNTL